MSDAWNEVEEAVELLEGGEHAAAFAELERVLAANPTNELAHHYRGHLLFEKGDYPEALRAYVRSLELAPGYVAARVGAGQCLRFLGEHDKAIRMAREALRVAPADADALFLAACVTFSRGERHASEQYLERFLATGPELEVALEARGMLRILRGEAAEDEPAEDDEA